MSLGGEETRFVALDEPTSFTADDTGGGPLVAPEKLLFFSPLRSAKLERLRYAEVRGPWSWKGETVALNKGEPRGEVRRFSLAFLLRSQKTIRVMKTRASKPPTTPPTIAPTGVCFEPVEVEVGAVKKRLGMEARLENEGVYVM